MAGRNSGSYFEALERMRDLTASERDVRSLSSIIKKRVSALLSADDKDCLEMLLEYASSVPNLRNELSEKSKQFDSARSLYTQKTARKDKRDSAALDELNLSSKKVRDSDRLLLKSAYQDLMVEEIEPNDFGKYELTYFHSNGQKYSELLNNEALRRDEVIKILGSAFQMSTEAVVVTLRSMKVKGLPSK